MTKVKAAFRPDVVKLKLKELIPSKELHPRERKHPKYRQIATSFDAVGFVEPLVVFPTERGYRVLDGHKRLDILRSRNAEEVECLIGTVNETYTYNRRVNYLSTIGEHKMILRALRHNTEETIANALNVDVSTIRKKRALLDGICKEAADVLKDRQVSPKAFAALRKMKPIRQIAAAQLMVASNMYSDRFAKALLAGTSDQMLAEPNRSYKAQALSPNQRARLIAETDSVLDNVKAAEASYGQEALTLSVCCRYLERLLKNQPISRHIESRHPEIWRELRSLAATARDESIDTSVPISES